MESPDKQPNSSNIPLGNPKGMFAILSCSPSIQLFDYESMKLSVLMPLHSYYFLSGNQ